MCHMNTHSTLANILSDHPDHVETHPCFAVVFDYDSDDIVVSVCADAKQAVRRADVGECAVGYTIHSTLVVGEMAQGANAIAVVRDSFVDDGSELEGVYTTFDLAYLMAYALQLDGYKGVCTQLVTIG
jgi:hypothetical protein